MRVFLLSLALVGTFAVSACQSNSASPDSTVDTGETPSDGMVPGQLPE